MMEVSAHLIGGPVYFAGDTVSCRVSFSNVRQTAGCPQNYIATK